MWAENKYSLNDRRLFLSKSTDATVGSWNKLNACCIRQHRHLYLATELRQIFGTARIVCKEESMNRYDVRPSVCPAAAACGGFAAAAPVGARYRLIAARPAGRRSAAARGRSIARSSKRHAYSWRRKLNTAGLVTFAENKPTLMRRHKQHQEHSCTQRKQNISVALFI